MTTSNSFDYSAVGAVQQSKAPLNFGLLDLLGKSEKPESGGENGAHPQQFSLCLNDLVPPPERKDKAEPSKDKSEPKLAEPDKTTAADMKLGFNELKKLLGCKDNDRISLNELGKGLGDPQISGSQAQVLAILKARFDQFDALDPSKNPKDKGISAKAIEKFDQLQKDVKSGKRTDAGAVDFVNDVESLMKQMRDVTKDTVRSLYADEKNPLNSIKLEDVKQSFNPNCYFYGAVGAVLASDPEKIKDLIKDNKDGTYTVTFPGKDPEIVKAPSDAELMLYPKPGKDGTWMWVLEKAYGQYCMKHDQMFRKIMGYPDSPISQDHTDGPGLFDEGLKILTGKGTNWALNIDKDKLAATLKDLTSEKPPRPITADASFNVKTGEGAPVWGHTYSVLGYNAADKTITLRNPWGSTPPKDAKDLGDGKFSMTMDQFCKYFSKISYTDK